MAQKQISIHSSAPVQRAAGWAAAHPWVVVLATVVIGLLAAFGAELLDGRSDSSDSDWDALREIGGALVASAGVGVVLLLVEQRRDAERDAHDQEIASEQRRQMLAVQLAVTRDLTGIILAGQDLRNITLAGRNLTDADFTGCDLTDANLSGATLIGATFDDTQLTRTDLSTANLERAHFHESQMFDTNLYHASMRSAHVSRCKLVRVIASDAEFIEASLAHNVIIQGEFRRSDFTDATIGKYDKIYRSDFEETDFTRAVVSGVRFSDDLPCEMPAGAEDPDLDKHWDYLDGRCSFYLSVWDETDISNSDFSTVGSSITGLDPDRMTSVKWSKNKNPTWPESWGQQQIERLQGAINDVD